MGYVKYLGHAAFEVELDSKIIYFDPWISGNPKAPIKVSDIKRADLVLVTHDHGDHLGDAAEICRRTGATFVGVYELALKMESEGVRNTVGMNIGGPAEVKGLKIIAVPATHSSTVGTPVGFIVIGKEGTVYHAGDTGLCSTVALYAELYPIDIALVPIGGHFTMDPKQAATFVKIIKPKVVIPMHYGTFPVIDKDPNEFKKLVEEYAPGVKVVVLKPGEEYRF